MSHDPFTPPGSDLKANPTRPGSVFRGVVMGGIVDIAGSILIGVLLLVLYLTLNSSPELSMEELVAQYQRDATRLGSLWSWCTMGLGLLCSFAGGFVCAALSREKMAQAVPILVVSMALIAFYLGAGSMEVGTNLAASLVTGAAVYAGGRYWRSRAAQTRTS